MDSRQYRVCKLPKGGGKFRAIYVPESSFKRELRSYLPVLNQIATDLDVNNVCHAFIKGRNCVTNAMQHIGYRYTVSLDLRDFFDSVRAEPLSGKVPSRILSVCLIDGAPRQGLPTSPLLANIALSEVDSHIFQGLKIFQTPFSYTRYADDLIISFDDKKAIAKVIYLIRRVMLQHGFVINARKTRIQSAANGRRVVTGIGVDEDGLHATRKTLRAMRAALHQKNLMSAKGLLNWALCKPPGHRMPDLYRYPSGKKDVECRFCREGGLEWYVQNKHRRILVHTESGNPHVCSAWPPPINRIDLELNLIGQGFTEVPLLSSTWDKGLSKASDDETLLVLFRKRGIDICIYDCVRHFFPVELPLAIGSNQIICRLSYDSNKENVHGLILVLARQLTSGERLNIAILDG